MSPQELIAIVAITIIGATLQGSVGFGFGLFSVPLLLVIEPALVPGPTLANMTLLGLAISVRHHEAIQLGDLKWAVGGRVFGIGGALCLLVIVPADALAPVLGGLILVAVVMTVSGMKINITPKSLAGAGAVSGFMGTAVSIGGPPMALLYQRESGPRVRGTLSAYFVIGISMSIVGLAAVGRFGMQELELTGALLPGTAIGFLISRYAAKLIDRGYTRSAILVLATVMGGVVVVRSLM